MPGQVDGVMDSPSIKLVSETGVEIGQPTEFLDTKAGQWVRDRVNEWVGQRGMERGKVFLDLISENIHENRANAICILEFDDVVRFPDRVNTSVGTAHEGSTRVDWSCFKLSVWLCVDTDDDLNLEIRYGPDCIAERLDQSFFWGPYPHMLQQRRRSLTGEHYYYVFGNSAMAERFLQCCGDYCHRGPDNILALAYLNYQCDHPKIAAFDAEKNDHILEYAYYGKNKDSFSLRAEFLNRSGRIECETEISCETNLSELASYYRAHQVRMVLSKKTG